MDVFSRFAEDVLPFDAATAKVYPGIVNHRDRPGTPISGYNAQIAAIYRANDAYLATRNEKDFAGVGVELIVTVQVSSIGRDPGAASVRNPWRRRHPWVPVEQLLQGVKTIDALLGRSR